MKLDRKQDLNVPYKVCVFRADQKNKNGRWTEFNENFQEARSQRPLPSCCFWAERKNKMAALTSDWLRHFRLLLWNHWTEFIEIWQEARSQRQLPSFVFFGLMRKNKMDNWNIVKCDMIGKTKWPPWPLIAWDIFNIFSEIAKRNSIPEVPQSPDARLS